jgi:hypothetical protein
MTPSIKPGRLTPGEARERLAQRDGHRLYEEAYAKGSNLSVWLNDEIGFDKERGLDGFEQILAEAGIRTHARLDYGIQADSVDKFFQEDNRALFPEWFSRQWRKIAFAGNGPQQRGSDIYMSSDLNALITGNVDGAVTVQRPLPLLEPAVPLNDIVAQTTGITGSTVYQAQYITEPAATETRMVRIAETAEIPRAKITTGKSAIRLYKYGRALEASYEELRRMRIDRLAFHVQRMAIQAEIDKVAAAIDVLILGDGNTNPAVSTNISSLDAAATGGAMTVLGWVSWKVKRNQGAYRLTTVLVQEATAIKMLMLNMGNANYPYAVIGQPMGLGGFTPMGNWNRTGDNVEFGVTTEVGATQIVGLDARQALERVFEIGGTVNEVARFVTRQTEVMTFTEVEGFSKIDVNAAWILNLA